MRLRYKKWQEEMIETNSDIALNESAIGTSEIKPFTRLEIGSGCGQFLLEMSAKYPDSSFLGVEINRTAFAIGVKKYFNAEIKPTNLQYLNSPVEKLLPTLKDESLDYIYLNFNDPWPKKRHHKRRLTFPTRLEEYYRLLKKGGELWVKTDNLDYFEGSLEYFEEFKKFVYTIDRNYQPVEEDVMSEYEQKFRAKQQPIYRLVAKK